MDAQKPLVQSFTPATRKRPSPDALTGRKTKIARRGMSFEDLPTELRHMIWGYALDNWKEEHHDGYVVFAGHMAGISNLTRLDMVCMLEQKQRHLAVAEDAVNSEFLALQVRVDQLDVMSQAVGNFHGFSRELKKARARCEEIHAGLKRIWAETTSIRALMIGLQVGLRHGALGY